jgi:hypothetical protein
MSIRLHNNDEYHLRVDLINGNSQIHNLLRKIYPNIDIVHYDIPKVKDSFDNPKNLLNLMRTRPPQMWRALNEDWDQILSLDCDTLIRTPIEGIWDDVEPGTIKILKRSNKKSSAMKFQGGVYVFGNSPHIKAYYHHIIKRIGKKFAFYDGQAALYTIYLKYQKVIRLIDLDEKYNNRILSDDAVIWHIKRDRAPRVYWGKKARCDYHEREDKYSKYVKLCLDEANKLCDN